MSGIGSPPKLQDFENKAAGVINTWLREANKSVNAPAFSAVMTAVTFSIPASTFTKVPCDGEAFDFTNAYNTTLFRFQPQMAGAYLISGTVNNTRIASIYKNGVEHRRGAQTSAGVLEACTVTSLVYLNGTTDYVELYTWQDVGAVNISGSSIFTYFSGVLVRPQ